jgi:hypothetical protein
LAGAKQANYTYIHEPEQACFASQKCLSLEKLIQKTAQKVTNINQIEKYQDTCKKHLNYPQARLSDAIRQTSLRSTCRSISAGFSRLCNGILYHIYLNQLKRQV